MQQFCIIQDGIPRVMELLKPAFPLMRELALEETFLHVELSPEKEERLFFTRTYYIIEGPDDISVLVPSTDKIELVLEALRNVIKGANLANELLTDENRRFREYIEQCSTKMANLEEDLQEAKNQIRLLNTRRKKKPYGIGTDIDPVDTLKNSDVEEKETDTWKALVSPYLQEQEAEPVVECLPALECAAPEEEFPKEEEVEYQPIYVKVKEVEGIKFKSLEFNYPADEFCPPEEYNSEEFGTVVVACIRWQTDIKKLVKELNENGCRSLSKELYDGRPPRRLNDEFAKYAEMEYNRGYKVTLVLEEPAAEEQAVLSELKTKADKVINKLFGEKK